MIFNLGSHHPEIHESVFLAPDSAVIGNVKIGKNSSVWFKTVLRGDADSIYIGEESNIQDLSLGHTDPGKPLFVGNRVTVGHRCILHGCHIEDECLIGMGAILMNDVRVGQGSIIGAGAVLLEGMSVPPFSLVVGSPATVKKTYAAEVLEGICRSAQSYAERAQLYLKDLSKL